MTAAEVRALLPTLADAAYQRFNQSLMPGVENVLGVRMPVLRKLAREIAKGDWRAYLAEASTESYEEIVLRGLVIDYAKADVETLLPYIEAHVTLLDNWAACDLFCLSLKIAREEPERMWAFVLPYFESPQTYPLRFAIVMALDHFLDEAHIDDVLALLDGITHDDYYVKMAVAWAVSMAYVAHPGRVLPYLQSNQLDDWTHNKSLQKIIESRQVNDEVRRQMRVLKRAKRKG